jgi:hypothetical protein
LKKEKSILSQMIVASFKRAELLQGEVGHYWFVPYITLLSSTTLISFRSSYQAS